MNKILEIQSLLIIGVRVSVFDDLIIVLVVSAWTAVVELHESSLVAIPYRIASSVRSLPCCRSGGLN